MAKKTLLIVAHTPSPNCVALVDAIERGANNEEIETVQVIRISPFDCDAEQVLKCDAIVMFTTENFGYMSGALKDFFERIYYPCLQDVKRNEAKPFALVIKAGLDGTGTDIAVHKITTGLRWKEVQPVCLLKGEFQQSFIDQCETLGLTMAASLDNELI